MKKRIFLLMGCLLASIISISKVNASTITWKAIEFNTDFGIKRVYREYIPNGSTEKQINTFNDAYIQIDGKTAFCLEMGKAVSEDGSTGRADATSTTKELTTYIPATYTATDPQRNITTSLSNMIALVSYYGGAAYDGAIKKGSTIIANKYYLATQGLIWQYLSKEFYKNSTIKSTYNIKDSNIVADNSYIDFIYGTYSAKTGKVTKYGTINDIHYKYQKEILDRIARYYSKPNFAVSNINDANSATINTTKTEDNKIIITDLNQTLSGLNNDGTYYPNFTIENIVGASSCIISQGYTITCENVSNDNVTFELKRYNPTTDNTGENTLYSTSSDNKYQAILLTNKLPELTYYVKVGIGTEDKYIKLIKYLSTGEKDENGKEIMERLEGVKFALYSDEATTDKISEGVTNENGIIVFNVTNKMETSTTFYLKEIDSIEGYSTKSDVIPLHFINNNDLTDEEKEYGSITDNVYTCKVANRIIKGNVEIIKKDAATGNVLEGVKFSIYDADYTKVGSGITNSEGKILFSGLAYGTYYVIEDEALSGYLLIEEEKAIDVSENDKTYTIEFINEKGPQTADVKVILIITLGICALVIAIIAYTKRNKMLKNNAI